MNKKLESYYRDHWAEVEPERMARYEAMFQWRDGQEVLIAPAEIGNGNIVMDYGCGPGALSIEIANRVGDNGKVIAVDINEQFLQKTGDFAAEKGFSDRVDTMLLTGNEIPVPDQSVDRIVSKNVLEYVPDPETTIREFHRLLKPGGIAHVTDSDWGSILLEPLGDQFNPIMSAAGIAFQTPYIGRKLYGLFRRAGFQDVSVQVLVSPDVTGGLRPVIHNMSTYARISGKVTEDEATAFLQAVDQAIEDNTYFAMLPQFLVTGRI